MGAGRVPLNPRITADPWLVDPCETDGCKCKLCAGCKLQKCIRSPWHRSSRRALWPQAAQTPTVTSTDAGPPRSISSEQRSAELPRSPPGIAGASDEGCVTQAPGGDAGEVSRAWAMPHQPGLRLSVMTCIASFDARSCTVNCCSAAAVVPLCAQEWLPFHLITWKDDIIINN